MGCIPLKAIEKPNLCPCFLFVTNTKTLHALHIMNMTMKMRETGTSGKTDGGSPSCAYGEPYGVPAAKTCACDGERC